MHGAIAHRLVEIVQATMPPVRPTKKESTLALIWRRKGVQQQQQQRCNDDGAVASFARVKRRLSADQTYDFAMLLSNIIAIL